MSNYKLPDSPEKQILIHWLKEKIRECKDGMEAEAGVQRRTQSYLENKGACRIYERILDMIR